jgi:hypothetical protein
MYNDPASPLVFSQSAGEPRANNIDAFAPTQLVDIQNKLCNSNQKMDILDQPMAMYKKYLITRPEGRGDCQ